MPPSMLYKEVCDETWIYRVRKYGNSYYEWNY